MITMKIIATTATAFAPGKNMPPPECLPPSTAAAYQREEPVSSLKGFSLAGMSLFLIA
jgi:hypothetical protein